MSATTGHWPGLLSYYESDSFLHRLNPGVKLIANLVLIVIVALFFDPFTPLSFLALSVALGWLLGAVPPGRQARAMLPFVPVGVGLLVYYSLFFRPAAGEPLTMLYSVGPASFSREGLRVGLSISLRLLAIVSFSQTFVATTNPTLLVMSLIQQFRLPYRLGYGALAAFRLLPLLESELSTIRAAHRIRGVGENPGLIGRWRQLKRYAIPLFADAIRKAERVALAMDSRAFGLLPGRTYYQSTSVRAIDWAFLAGVLVASSLILLTLSRFGILTGFLDVPR
jgi:energy-coupling factor transport system permease protein